LVALAGPHPPPGRYRDLDSREIIKTIAALQARISERLGDSGLARVCAELLVIAKDNSARAQTIAAANVPLRLAVYVMLAIGVAALLWIVWLVRLSLPTDGGLFSILQGVEAAANLIVLVGAPAFLLTRLEEHMKRRQALSALHEMRSIIHVIDMHQLTKDPSAMSIGATASSPARKLGRSDTARYLDYCSEMLSLSSKIAVLYAQVFPDPAVVEAVSDIERLATGLSQKIWQKIMILQAEGFDSQVDSRPPA
jgi:hypothetical protein